MKNSQPRAAWVAVIASFILMIGMYGYFRLVLIPGQVADDTIHAKPRGNLSDLYPIWVGARELLLHHRDPYSDDVTREIQKGVWGRMLDSSNPNDPRDEKGLAYPLFVIFLMIPAIALPFDVVQYIYVAISIALTAASVWLWWRALSHRDAFPQLPVGAMLLIGSFPVIQSLFLQQPAIVVAALIGAACAAIGAEMYWASGVLLALAMIKPQSAVPVAGWLLIWSLSKWKDRKGLFIAFGATMAALCAGAELLLPGWIWKWRAATAAYLKNTDKVPANVRMIFGNYPGTVVGLILVLAVIVFCWKSRGDSPASDRFKLAPALILAVSMAVTPIWHAYDHMFLLPAVLLIFHWRRQFDRLHPFARAVVSLSAVAFLWQWVGALVLAVIALVSPELARSWQALPVLPVFFSPALVLIALTLIARAQLSESTFVLP